VSPTLKKHLIRYLIGGASTTVLTWGCVWLFIEIFSFHYLISTNLATFCAYFYSYLVNKIFVFDDRQGGHVIKGSRFLILQLSMLAFANAFMFTSVSLLGFHYMPSVVVVSVLAAMISFTVMRLSIFEVDEVMRTSNQ
jgi:putative flippase GtrA